MHLPNRANKISSKPIMEMPTTQRIIPSTTKKSVAANGTLTITPQPFMEQFELNFQAVTNSTIQLQIINLLGQTVYTQSWEVNAGLNQLSIPTGDWQSGSYCLQIMENGQMVKSEQLIKQD